MTIARDMTRPIVPGVPDTLGRARVGARLTSPRWGTTTSRMVHNGATYGVSVGPDSDVAAYMVDGGVGSPFVVSVDCPWVGFLPGPVVVTPLIYGDDGAGGTMYLHRSDVLLWDRPPETFANARRPRYLNGAQASDDDADQAICVHGRRTIRIVADNDSAGPVDVYWRGAFCEILPTGIDGSNVTGAAAMLVVPLPDATTFDVIPPGEKYIKEINITDFWTLGVDFIAPRFVSEVANERARWFRVEAHD